MRPVRKVAPLPIPATTAVALRAPIPGTVTKRWHAASVHAMSSMSAGDVDRVI
jgi:hypothetical protein